MVCDLDIEGLYNVEGQNIKITKFSSESHGQNCPLKNWF